MIPILNTLFLAALSVFVGIALFLIVYPNSTSTLFYSVSEHFTGEQPSFPKLSACNCLPGFIQQKVDKQNPNSPYNCIQLKDMKTIRPCY
jgi:hypothetical protein